VTADEGRLLREAGVDRPILVVQPSAPMLEACARHGLTPGLGSVDEVRRWRSLAPGRAFHLQVDTGMNRGGIWWEELRETAGELAGPGLEGAFTHFHSAERDAHSVQDQWERFGAALAALPARPQLVHAANSAAALVHPETAADLVRPGIFLYGGAVGAFEPRPAAAWRARVLRVAWREAGATVSYGATYRTTGRECVVTLAVGYADGYRRALSNAGAVLLEGRRWRVAGTVTMDMIMVAGPGPAPAPDALATLIGRDGDQAITLDEVAATAGTISYEILTGLGPRVERVWS
jgi:alanine racemase